MHSPEFFEKTFKDTITEVEADIRKHASKRVGGITFADGSRYFGEVGSKGEAEGRGVIFLPNEKIIAVTCKQYDGFTQD